MSTDLEQRLEADLTELAVRTPWTSRDVAGIVHEARRRRTRRALLRASLAVVALTGATAAIVSRNQPGHPPISDTTVSTVAPQGRAVPIRPSATQPFDDALGRSQQSVVVDDRFEIGLQLRAMFLDGVLVPQSCITINIAGSCNFVADEGVPARPEVAGSDQLISWSNVPAGTSFVQFVEDATMLWQQPVDGIVAFPVSDWHRVDSMVAHDATGRDLGRPDLSDLESSGMTGYSNGTTTEDHEFYFSGPLVQRPSLASTDWADLSDVQRSAREKLAGVLQQNCVGDDRSLSAWWTCVQTTNELLRRATTAVPMPPLAATTLHGQTVDLADRAGHWLVIQFSASTCAPCTEQIPMLRDFDTAQSQLQDDAELYTVEIGSSDQGEVRAFYDDHPTTWPVLLDEDNQIAAAFNISTIPEIWIIDPIGSIATRLVAPVTQSDLTKALDSARGDWP